MRVERTFFAPDCGGGGGGENYQLYVYGNAVLIWCCYYCYRLDHHGPTWAVHFRYRRNDLQTGYRIGGHPPRPVYQQQPQEDSGVLAGVGRSSG